MYLKPVHDIFPLDERMSVTKAMLVFPLSFRLARLALVPLLIQLLCLSLSYLAAPSRDMTTIPAEMASARSLFAAHPANHLPLVHFEDHMINEDFALPALQNQTDILVIKIVQDCVGLKPLSASLIR